MESAWFWIPTLALILYVEQISFRELRITSESAVPLTFDFLVDIGEENDLSPKLEKLKKFKNIPLMERRFRSCKDHI